MASMPATEPHSSATAESPHTAPTRRWWLWITGSLIVLLLVLVGLVAGAIYSETGARLLWQSASRLLGDRLDGVYVSGTLGRGLKLRQVVWRDDRQRISIDRLDSGWRLSLAPLTLNVFNLRMGSADVVLLPVPPKPPAPLQEMTLPLAFHVQDASLKQLLIHRNASTARYQDIRLQASSDGIQHTIKLEHAKTPYGIGTAALRLNGVSPFALDGSGELKGIYLDEPYRLQAALSGSLDRLAVTVKASGKKLTGRATLDVTPFDDIPLRLAQIDVRHFNPAIVNGEWPVADLDIQASLAPTDGSMRVVSGPVSVRNALPGKLDAGRLPLESADAVVRLDKQSQRLSRALIKLLGKGTISGGGELRDGQGTLQLQAEAVDLHTLHGGLRSTSLTGPIRLGLAGPMQTIELKLDDPLFSVAAKAETSLKTITLHSASVRSGDALLAVKGTLARDEAAGFSLKGKLSDFNPGLFVASMQSKGKKAKTTLKARINTDFELKGLLRPELKATLQFSVYDSMYDRLPMTGGGQVQLAGQRLLPSDAQLSIAGNEIRLKGSFGQPSDRLRLDVDAPALNRLGFGVSGLLRLNGWLGGTLKQPVIDASYRAEGLAFGDFRLAHLSGEARSNGVPGSSSDARVKLDLDAQGLNAGMIKLDKLNATLDGSYASHRLRVEASGQLRGQPLDVALAADGRLRQEAQGMAWQGRINSLRNQGQPNVHLMAPLTVSLAPGRIELGSSRLSIARASIDLKGLLYSRGLIRSEGEIKGLDVRHLLGLWHQFGGTPPTLDTDLVFDSSWKFAIADTASGFIAVKRRDGDVRVIRNITLGLTELSLRADLQGKSVALDTQVRATRIGSISAQGHIALKKIEGQLTLSPQSEIDGHLLATLPTLRPIAALAGPGLALDGNATIDLTAMGTLAQPRWSGKVNGDALALTLYDQGIQLRDGVVRLELTDNIVELQRFEFKGGEGTLSARGRIPLDRSSRELTASIVASKLQLLASPSGQLTLSGNADAANINGALEVTGAFVVDKARFSLPEKTAPRLGDDVVIKRGGAVISPARQASRSPSPSDAPASPFTPAIKVNVDLGNDFRFTGSGADLRLTGILTVRSDPGFAPEASGTLHVAEGTYEAFGTKLAIERGILNFQGALTDPNINIVAMRREGDVAAGVQVTGTVRRPRVLLVSEPNMSAEEKLSWLVFGRSGGNTEPGQAQAAAKGAAIGLLNAFGGDRIAKGFGLDALSFGDSEFGLEGGQVVNLGKKISERLYLGYEQSLAGAESVLKVSYQLSQSWALVLRGGTVTGLEASYSKRFDSIHLRKK